MLDKFEALPIKQKLLMGFAIPLAMMVILSSIVFTSVKSLITSSHWVKHTYEAIDMGKGITSSLINMETGLRGFLVSGKEEFLEPFFAGEQQFQELIDATKTKVSDNAVQVERLKKIETLKEDWIENHVIPAKEYRKDVTANVDTSRNFKEISSRIVGKQYFDGFRARIASLKSEFEKINSTQGLALTNNLLLQMVNQETGQRGFLLSGKEESLEPYHSGIIEAEKTTNQIKALLKRLPASSAKKIAASLDVASDQAEKWRSEAALPEIEARRAMNKVSRTMDDITQFIEKGIGKNYMDQMRAILNEFVTAEQILIVSRSEQSEADAGFVISATVIGTLISIVIAVISAITITRFLIQQLGGEPSKLQAVAEQIVAGNLRGSDTSRDYKGVMQSMIKMREQLAEVIENKELKDIIDAAKRGDLSQRIDLSGKVGSFKQLSHSINALIAINEAIVNDTLNAVQAMSRGDLSQKIQNNYEGSFNTLKDSLNKTMDQFIAIIQTDIQNMVVNAQNGDLNHRIKLDDKTGVFEELSTSMNKLLDVFVQVIDDTSSVFSSLSKGDLSTNISTDYNGRYDELKNDANDTVQKLKQVIEGDVQALITQANEGNLSGRISLDAKEGFFYLLCEKLNSLFEINENVINEVSTVMGSVASGNLNNEMSGNYSGKFLELKNSVNTTVKQLTEIVNDINRAAHTVQNISSEISSGNEDLRSRSESQASSLEETAASMEEITSTINMTAEKAKSASLLSQTTSHKASDGSAAVQKANTAMAEILRSSNQITEIIGVIDEIAFQTNLLALNAAVEAARAGEMGRGFAVVASEVRSLSKRSADAAKEIKDLIRDSVAKVQSGTDLVNASGETLSEIMVSVESVAKIITELSGSAAEQASGVKQINSALNQIDDMNQQNAALVEEASASSMELLSQAQTMKKKVEFFKT